MLLLDERHRILKGGIGVATTVALLAVSIMLLRLADLPTAGRTDRPWRFISSATGPRHSASCWCWIASPRSCWC